MFHKKITIFYVLSLIALLGLIISSIILISSKGMNQRLQGWVNLVWIPLPLAILFMDRLGVRKFKLQKLNRLQLYILGVFVLTVMIFYLFL